uniref:Uncharacterized protein n=1 Tax=Romanomermis culicivorax TaxID=13658 RepID=A0A915HLG2_ROMCU
IAGKVSSKYHDPVFHYRKGPIIATVGSYFKDLAIVFKPCVKLSLDRALQELVREHISGVMIWFGKSHTILMKIVLLESGPWKEQTMTKSSIKYPLIV